MRDGAWRVAFMGSSDPAKQSEQSLRSGTDGWRWELDISESAMVRKILTRNSHALASVRRRLWSAWNETRLHQSQ